MLQNSEARMRYHYLLMKIRTLNREELLNVFVYCSVSVSGDSYTGRFGSFEY